MTCQECQIELFEDTPGRDALIHVGECEGCRTLAREIRANSEALAALRGEELAARPFVQPRRFRPWVWGLAAAAALLFGIVFSRTPDRQVAIVPEVTPLVEQARVEPPAPTPEIKKRTQVAPRTAPRNRARSEPSTVLPVETAAEPLLVKMLTSDPDVVIYWLIDPDKGERVL